MPFQCFECDKILQTEKATDKHKEQTGHFSYNYVSKKPKLTEVKHD